MCVRVVLMLMIAGDQWHDYMQVEYSAHAPKYNIDVYNINICGEVEAYKIELNKEIRQKLKK